MMLTESDAMDKWCPFVRLAAPCDSEAAGTAGNRFSDAEGGNFRCIASRCMAWTFHDNVTSMIEEGEGGDLVLRLKRKPGEPKMGFCGLAGKP